MRLCLSSASLCLSLQRVLDPVHPSLRRVPWVRVPRLRRYSGVLRLPSSIPRTLVASRTGTTSAPLAVRYFREATARPPGGQGFVIPAPRRVPSLLVETVGPPRFLGDPFVCMPRSLTPAECPPPGHLGESLLPSGPSRPSAALRLSISGLDHAAYTLAVYASQAGSPQSTQDSLPAGGQPWPGGIGYPLDPG